MNNLNKQNAFTNVGLQQLETDLKSVTKINVTNVKLTNKSKQNAQNNVEKIHDIYSSSIGNCSVEAIVKKQSYIDARKNARKKLK